MAREKVALKSGLGGSSAGRGRTAKTADLKRSSKKGRRREDQRRAEEGRRPAAAATVTPLPRKANQRSVKVA